eukprot:scaffold2144_cov149-Skeletonema_menzelii.AAC.15
MMPLPSIFRVAAFISAIISCAHAFSLDAARSAKHVAIHQQGCRTSRHKTLSQQPCNGRIVMRASESDQEEDDGWGDDSVSTTAESSSDRISKSQELANLQKDMAMKQQNNSMQVADMNESKERDLFIPIFALVSIIGFSSLYGYETLRLNQSDVEREEGLETFKKGVESDYTVPTAEMTAGVSDRN